MPYSIVEPIIDVGVRTLCLRPYSNHSKGCPNYGKRDTCPPKCPEMKDIFNLDKPIYVIWNVFNFKKHCDRIREKHPNWSERQVECCLYWQGTARKALREEIKKFIYNHAHFKIVTCPEAMGVNITKTMKNVDQILEWPPIQKTYQVALAGYPRIS